MLHPIPLYIYILDQLSRCLRWHDTARHMWLGMCFAWRPMNVVFAMLVGADVS